MRYLLDAADCISSVSDDWLPFAAENGAPHLRPEAVVQRSLWHFVSGAETRHLWELLLRRARAGQALDLTVRCDAPHARRLLRLTATGGDRTVEITTSVLREEPRLPVELLRPRTSTVGPLVTVCSWCNRVRVPPETWLEVEEAVGALGLFRSSVMPGVTHGLCRACFADVAGEGDRVRS